MIQQRDYMMETLACIKEIITYSEKTLGEHQFLSICSLGMDAQSESFTALERWLDAIFIIKGNTNPFEISIYSINRQPDPANLKIVYSLSSNLEILSINFDK